MLRRTPAVAGAVFVVLLATSLAAVPAASPLAPDPGEPTQPGDGTATVEDPSLSGDLSVSSGRFGADVHYLRLPTAILPVTSVAGQPRLVYRVQAPALDLDVVTTQVLRDGQRGVYRLAHDDLVVPAGSVGDGGLPVRLTVRAESFTTSRTILNATRPVGGSR